jgi:hypothetical protein
MRACPPPFLDKDITIESRVNTESPIRFWANRDGTPGKLAGASMHQRRWMKCRSYPAECPSDIVRMLTSHSAVPLQGASQSEGRL